MTMYVVKIESDTDDDGYVGPFSREATAQDFASRAEFDNARTSVCELLDPWELTLA